MLSGERYDFVLIADQKVDNYWIRFQGDMFCVNIKSQLTVLKYKNASDDARPIDRPSYSMMSLFGEGLRVSFLLLYTSDYNGVLRIVFRTLRLFLKVLLMYYLLK